MPVRSGRVLFAFCSRIAPSTATRRATARWAALLSVASFAGSAAGRSNRPTANLALWYAMQQAADQATVRIILINHYAWWSQTSKQQDGERRADEESVY